MDKSAVTHFRLDDFNEKVLIRSQHNWINGHLKVKTTLRFKDWFWALKLSHRIFHAKWRGVNPNYVRNFLLICLKRWTFHFATILTIKLTLLGSNLTSPARKIGREWWCLRLHFFHCHKLAFEKRLGNWINTRSS